MSLSKSDIDVLKSIKDKLLSEANVFFNKSYTDKGAAKKDFDFFSEVLNRILSEAEFSASLSSGLSRERVLDLLIHSPDFVHQFFGIPRDKSGGHMLLDVNGRSLSQWNAAIECDNELPLLWGRGWADNDDFLLKAKVYWRDGGNHFRVKLSFPDRTVELRRGAHSQYIVLLPKTDLGKAVFGFILSDPSVLLDAFRVRMSPRFRPEKTMNAISLYSTQVVELSGRPGVADVWPGSELFG